MKIAILPGDGIGVDVTAQAVKVLRAALGATPCEFSHGLIGGAAFDATGDSLPPETIALVKESDAVFLGATGTPEDEHRPPADAVGRSTLRLRQELGLFANFRPAYLFPELIGASALKPEVVTGLDLIILRELNGDVYYGEPRGIATDATGQRFGFNTMRYSESEVERIGRAAFDAARTRRKKVCSVDKANVLETSALWREVMTRVGRDYPDVALTHMYVDAAAMALMRNPTQFDVVVTGNIFGDILSDAAAMLTGSIGMLPSASLGAGRKGLYEPVHGSAPDIAGKNLANPLAAILSAAMMLRHSFEMEKSAVHIEVAVRRVLHDGYRTADIYEPGTREVGTREMGERVAEQIHEMV